MTSKPIDTATDSPKDYVYSGVKYTVDADFALPNIDIPSDKEAIMRERLIKLYGAECGPEVYEELERILLVHGAHKPLKLREMEAQTTAADRISGNDVVLITYGDLIESLDKTPLKTLTDIAGKLFKGTINTIHILPFYPYSSDRGFSVVDYQRVDPNLGTWEDVAELGDSFKLMFDAVINHCSAKCRWFRRFLSEDPDFDDYFIAFDSPDEISPEDMRKILRPRLSELLSPYDTVRGKKYVWTTFSRDQADLNLKSPRVLCKLIRILLDYVRRGAGVIRLDAITYLWKELGTSCAHVDQTHEVAKLMRDVLDVAAKHVVVISETNVPHEDNITYFGNGTDEAQMVYNFALPPLVLHTFMTGHSGPLSQLAKILEPPSQTTSFFNFLDSHDGIGVLGARGYLTPEEVDTVCQTVEDRGGYVSMKDNGDGTQCAYELNTTWFSALNPEDTGESDAIQIGRFIASRAVALVLKGVPAIYMHSMFASKNDREGAERDGVKRSINRAALHEETVFEMLADRESVGGRIHYRFMDLLKVRVSEPAFHPNGPQQVMELGANVFAIKRTSLDGESTVLCLINVTDQDISVDVPLADLDMGQGPFTDLASEETAAADGDSLKVALKPYQVAWYK